jgi:hypothetical protein
MHRSTKKGRWIVVRIASRGRSWGPARRNLVVKARTLGRAITKALSKANVDLKRGTGLTFVIELKNPKAGDHRAPGSTTPASSGESTKSTSGHDTNNLALGSGGGHGLLA